MQLTIGRPTDGRQATGSMRQAAAKSDPYRQNIAKQHKHKSQPFDPDDLRRRLYVVIAEQESREKKRRERLAETGSTRSKDHDTPTSQPKTGKPGSAVLKIVTTKPDSNETRFAARMAINRITASDSPSQESSDQPLEAKAVRSMSKSIQDRIRRKPPKVESTPTESAANAPSSHYIPQEAATQFERTATASSMRERNLVHSLSQTALKFHVDGRLSDRAELDASMTPAQQNRALERAISHREKIHERNQFQTPRPVSDGHGVSEETGHYRRHSVIGLTQIKSRRRSSIGNILEDETPAVHPCATIELPIEEISSEDTLIVDPATVNEHRVDWTQSDEVDARPKTATKNPLLRKADSLWTLKGRLGNRNLIKNGHSRDEKAAAIREKQDDSFTSPSSPRFLRLGFLTKFRR
ncbi:hypothetical protein F4804DRAFT_284619 [Jackrogersella minutella]|nr:hypothetical protein F4804DRAFT_284619 [Jackrogersella minutella]